MRTVGSTIAAVLVGCAIAIPTAAQRISWPAAPSAIEANPAIEARVTELLEQMTLEQKVGQMVQAEIRNVSPADVRKYHLGSILNGGGSFPGGKKNASREDWVALADDYYNASMDAGSGRVPIPIIWGTDAVHGHNNVIGATLFPHNIGLGATRNPDLIEQIGEITAREVAATGIDWVFAPTLAVVRDDRWGRTYEGYSEDPELVRDYGGPIVDGLQGTAGEANLFDASRVIATAKHYIGDGGTDGGIDQGNNLASETELLEIHAQGYLTALAAGAQTVMATFNSWQGRKVHGDKYLLTDVLKDQLGFDGFVVSDWNGIGQVSGCTNQSCPQAINAGIDMIMAPEENWRGVIRNTIKQVESGEIPQERIDDAVRRILRVKLRAGLFDKGAPSTRPLANDDSVLGAPAHREVAAQAVRESLVLLKNKNGILPLSPGLNVLVAGDGADNIGKQSGGWTISWQGRGNSNADFPGASSILDGIRRTVEAAGGTVNFAADGKHKDSPDVAVVVFGEEPYAEGQGDRQSLGYSAERGGDLELLQSLREKGIPVVSVFITGRPLWVNPELNASDAFVVAWLPGSEGAAIADVLFGNATGTTNVDFSGKLSFSWPANPMQATVNRGDPEYAPLFPYGYGLTYSDTDSLGDDLPADLGTAAAAASRQPGDDLLIFDRRPAAPFKGFIGDQGGWQVPLQSGVTKSNAGALTVTSVDLEVQEDALQVAWSGKGEGQFYFQSGEPLDIRKLAKKDAALQLLLRVDVPPKKNVTLRMDCVYPCASSADISKLLQALPTGEWLRLTIDLRCFSKKGLKLEKVDTPFLLLTGGKTTLSMAQIGVVAGAGKNAAISCR